MISSSTQPYILLLKNDTLNRILLLDQLEKVVVRIDSMDRQTREIVDLFCATSDGTPQDLQRCIARGCPWDKPLPARSTQMMFRTTTPTIPINIAAQYKRHENLAILATKALEAGRPELLESPNLEGHSPAYLAVQNGSPQCLGVMAKAGANLHRACPHIYQSQVREIT